MVSLRQGSSPRVRGKAPCRKGTRVWRGIIPAGAGKSSPSRQQVAFSWDHPRGCGEKRLSSTSEPKEKGSSPRVRGKVDPPLHPLAEGGIIPAGAGKRRSAGTKGRCPGDHPRGCGEKSPTLAATVPSMGSSPRVRGKARAGPRATAWRGIIPAGAGKSPPPGLVGLCGEDHPRGCGEKGWPLCAALSRQGSSPRVRGKDYDRVLKAISIGIIPAGAGKSRDSSCQD